MKPSEPLLLADDGLRALAGILDLLGFDSYEEEGLSVQLTKAVHSIAEELAICDEN